MLLLGVDLGCKSTLKTYVWAEPEVAPIVAIHDYMQYWKSPHVVAIHLYRQWH